MSTHWTLYVVGSAVFITWGLLAGHRPSITFGFSIVVGILFLFMDSPFYRRLIKSMPPKAGTLVIIAAGVLGFTAYRLFRLVANLFGW